VTTPPSFEQDALKRLAAARAVEDIEDGMVVGLGSGSTAAFAIEALALRVAQGLRVAGIPTSEKSEALARRLGVPLTSFADHNRIDITVDGADQVERGSLTLIKGLGGALLREKLVASASVRMIVVVDETKLVDRLGGHTPLPVEIVSFGWQIAHDRLAALGCAPRLRLADGKPFTTDGGNFIADCAIDEITDPATLESQIAAVVGVVESGLFIGLASEVVVGRPGGVEVIARRFVEGGIALYSHRADPASGSASTQSDRDARVSERFPSG
jgi:ribose 5-phosphate isomerase A